MIAAQKALAQGNLLPIEAFIIDAQSLDLVRKASKLSLDFNQETLHLRVPKEATLAKPLALNMAHFSKVHIQLDNESEASIIQYFNDVGETKNKETTIEQGTNSKLQYVQMVELSEEKLLSHKIQANLHEKSYLQGTTLNFSAQALDHTMQISLLEPKAHCTLLGLDLLGGANKAHTEIRMEHLAAHTKSNQVFHGAFSDKAQGSFLGAICVRPQACKIEAHQMVRSLLLSKNSVSRAKPQLEIYNHDVICTHGTSLGKLDEQALFYLSSRGISVDEAQKMLIFGFAQEILSHFSEGELKNALKQKIRSRIYGSWAWSDDL